MRAQPSVSVVIPAHNSANTIGRALNSVFAQTRLPDEIIVVDDQSIDRTRQVAANCSRGIVRVISTDRRRGAGGARNTGICAATGDLIAFLDADDEWLPKKTQKQLDLLVADPRLCFVTCGASSISPTGVNLGDTYGRHRIAAGSEAWKALLASNFIATPSVVVWRKHLQMLGGFDETMKIGEDQDMWIRLALTGCLGYVPDPLVRVHLRGDSLSSWTLNETLANLLTYTLPMIERHLNQQRHRLTDREVGRILGERLSRFGRAAYIRGDLVSGLHLIGRSILLGYRPAESALYLLRAAPPFTWIKRQLGFGFGT